MVHTLCFLCSLQVLICHLVACVGTTNLLQLCWFKRFGHRHHQLFYLFFSYADPIFLCLYLFCFIFFAPLYFSVCLTCQLRKHISNLSCSFFISAFAASFPLFSFSLVSLPVCLSPLAQRERRVCAAVWLAAVSGACLSWPTYRWRPRICGRFPVNPSSWLKNWEMASLEKSGWVGMVVLCCGGGKVTAGAHLDKIKC